jgi:hypothetical protein
MIQRKFGPAVPAPAPCAAASLMKKLSKECIVGP